MARTAKQGLSKHEKKGYRISVGRKPDGGYRTFWLGHDRIVAEYGAEMYRRNWAGIEIRDGTFWTPEDEALVRQGIESFRQAIRGQLPARWQLDLARAEEARAAVLDRQQNFAQTFAEAPVNEQPAPATAVPATPMLHAAIDAYMEAFKNRATSQSHKERTRQLLDDLKHFRADVPLATVDRVWLQTLTDYIKSRPKARKRGTPLAPLTVRNTLRTWSRFFDWLDGNADSPRFGGWQAPRRWEELFEVRLTKLMSKVERDAHADGPKHLTIDQVVRLYRAAKNDVHHICVLLGVFAALGQREIASLRRDEFDLTTGILTHRRSKTGQLGKFWLPPEAVTLIKRYFREVTADGDNIAFYTAGGSVLVTDNSDAVRQAWTDIVDRVNKEEGPKIEKRMQGFYALRKFAADYAMRKGGPVVRDTFLAHAPESVGAKHYSNSRNFDEVFAVGTALHAELLTKEMFKAPAKQEQVKEKQRQKAKSDSFRSASRGSSLATANA